MEEFIMLDFDNSFWGACPQIGTKAPAFEAVTTFGDIKLSDLEGKWVVLFSHPGDFTPVCTTEFVAFQKRYDQFLVEDSATGLAVYWSQDNTLLYMGITGLGPGWAAVGFNPSFAMKDANIIMMAFSEDQALIRDDFGVSNFDHQPDTELGGTSDIEEHAGSPDAFEFVILLDSGDEYDQELIPGQTYKMILAVSDSPDFDSKHSKRSSVSVSLN